MFDIADYGLDHVELWPENWPAWRLFCDLSTQWRVGPSGATGLDYGPLFRLLDGQDLTPADWQDRFADVRALEAAAMHAMSTTEP